MKLKSAAKLSVILTLIGAAAAIAIAAAAAWADFEGLSYFKTGAGYASFDGLACPSVISLREEAQITARFVNPTDRTIEPNYRVEISGGTEFRRLAGKVTVPARGRQEISWTVGEHDVDLGYFVLVRMTVLPMAGQSTRQATCGMLALDLGGTNGGPALTLAVALTGAILLSGLLAPAMLLKPKERPGYDAAASTPRRRAQQALAITSAGAILPALGSAWLAAWLLCVIAVLLLLIVLRDALA